MTHLFSFSPENHFLCNTSLDFSLYNQLIQQAFSSLSERKQTNQTIHIIYIVASKKIVIKESHIKWTCIGLAVDYASK